MDSMDSYIERLSEPAVRSYWRRIHHIDEEGPGPDDGSKVSEEQVTAAEEELGIALPPTYRKLVTTTEPYDGVYGVYWVNESALPGADIVSAKRSAHSPLPPFLIAVVGRDNGDEYCFDTRNSDDRGEYPIVYFDHEVHNEESTEFETVANDLGEFLLGSLGGETSS
jgi:SMI1 / KNR4 family (SUKH-1)